MLGYQEIKKDIETETELLSLPAKGERFLCKVGSGFEHSVNFFIWLNADKGVVFFPIHIN
jgi:hypothetical protein